MSELKNLLKQLSEAKVTDPQYKLSKKIQHSVKESAKTDLGSLFAELANLQKKKNDIIEQNQELVKEDFIQEVTAPSPVGNIPPEAQVVPVSVAKYIQPSSTPAPEVAPLTNELKQLNDKIKFLERWIGQIQNAGPGSGEVNLRYLDDVDRSTIAEGRHLAYNATTKKFFFEEVSTGSELVDDDATTEISNGVVSVINVPNETLGPIQGLQFDTTHEHEGEAPGTLCWNPTDDTLNIQHSAGVVQQVGQELYVRAKNNTGTTITNGSVVRFAGASMNGESTLEVAPFEGDGTFPSLYTLGVATQDIASGAKGYITVWGKVREVNTTGGAENWQVGDILFVSSTVAGAFTNVKPTAPNNVIPVAAVLRVDATEGEIFVRPTIEQKNSYGTFERTTDLAVAAINTAYVVDFDTTEIANGVERVVGNTTRLQVDQSGLYQIDISAQVDASGGGFSSGTMYVWLRKNGIDVPDSTRRQGVLGSAPSANIGFAIPISLNANDYIEIAYAGDNTNLRFDAAAATAFAPSTAAVKVNVTQVQL